MKPILLSIAILLAGGSAYWGYSVGQNLDETGKQNIKVQEIERKTDNERQTTEDERDQMLKNLDLASRAQVASAEALRVAQEENGKLTGELDAVKNQLATIEAELKKLVDDEDPRDPDQMVAELDRLEAAMKEKEARITEIATLTESTLAKLTPLEADYKKLSDRLAKYKQTVASNSKEYSVTAVDPQWGFVIIDAGQASGLDPAVPLVVLRNGERQGVLKITQVEKNRTIADIVPSSVKPGNTLQIGDRVIPRRPQGQ